VTLFTPLLYLPSPHPSVAAGMSGRFFGQCNVRAWFIGILQVFSVCAGGRWGGRSVWGNTDLSRLPEWFGPDGRVIVVCCTLSVCTCVPGMSRVALPTLLLRLEQHRCACRYDPGQIVMCVHVPERWCAVYGSVPSSRFEEDRFCVFWSSKGSFFWPPKAIESVCFILSSRRSRSPCLN